MVPLNNGSFYIKRGGGTKPVISITDRQSSKLSKDIGTIYIFGDVLFNATKFYRNIFQTYIIIYV